MVRIESEEVSNSLKSVLSRYVIFQMFGKGKYNADFFEIAKEKIQSLDGADCMIDERCIKSKLLELDSMLNTHLNTYNELQQCDLMFYMKLMFKEGFESCRDEANLQYTKSTNTITVTMKDKLKRFLNQYPDQWFTVSNIIYSNLIQKANRGHISSTLRVLAEEGFLERKLDGKSYLYKLKK